MDAFCRRPVVDQTADILAKAAAEVEKSRVVELEGVENGLVVRRLGDAEVEEAVHADAGGIGRVAMLVRAVELLSASLQRGCRDIGTFGGSRTTALI